MEFETDAMSLNLEDRFPLLALPLDVLGRVLTKLDARSMVNVELTSRLFRERQPGSGVRVMERAAREAYEANYGPRQDHSWK